MSGGTSSSSSLRQRLVVAEAVAQQELVLGDRRALARRRADREVDLAARPRHGPQRHVGPGVAGIPRLDLPDRDGELDAVDDDRRGLCPTCGRTGRRPGRSRRGRGGPRGTAMRCRAGRTRPSPSRRPACGRRGPPAPVCRPGRGRRAARSAGRRRRRPRRSPSAASGRSSWRRPRARPSRKPPRRRRRARCERAAVGVRHGVGLHRVRGSARRRRSWSARPVSSSDHRFGARSPNVGALKRSPGWSSGHTSVAFCGQV